MRDLVADLIGVPYAHGGRDQDGLDCLGLLKLVFAEHGIEIPDEDSVGVSADWYLESPSRYLRGIEQFGDEVPDYRGLRPLDVVYFEMLPGIVTHVGVMIDTERFIHVVENNPVRVDRIRHRFWQKRMVGARRLA